MKHQPHKPLIARLQDDVAHARIEVLHTGQIFLDYLSKTPLLCGIVGSVAGFCDGKNGTSFGAGNLATMAILPIGMAGIENSYHGNSDKFLTQSIFGAGFYHIAYNAGQTLSKIF